MTLKKHHKIIIGSFSFVIIVFMIISGIFTFMLFTRQELNYLSLNKKITEVQADTQNKLNELTINLLQTKESLETSKEELTLLKASVGEDFSGIFEEAINSIITIRTDVSQGTGFIIDEAGYIVTNSHILVGATEIKAVTSKQEIIDANFIGYNGNLDIALLKISGNYKALKLADSNEIQVGEKVIAIGNPLGLQFSVVDGIISQIHRPGPSGLEAYVQTSAPLNPGNSGGPLINNKGKVVGINNFKIHGTEGMGFALESNYIKSSVNEISQQILNQTLI